jgi:hypothetical protein
MDGGEGLTNAKIHRGNFMTTECKPIHFKHSANAEPLTRLMELSDAHIFIAPKAIPHIAVQIFASHAA